MGMTDYGRRIRKGSQAFYRTVFLKVWKKVDRKRLAIALSVFVTISTAQKIKFSIKDFIIFCAVFVKVIRAGFYETTFVAYIWKNDIWLWMICYLIIVIYYHCLFCYDMAEQAFSPEVFAKIFLGKLYFSNLTSWPISENPLSNNCVGSFLNTVTEFDTVTLLGRTRSQGFSWQICDSSRTATLQNNCDLVTLQF